MSDPVENSKFLALVLRHKPEEIGITLDDTGWVSVETLLAALAAHRRPMTRDQLEKLVAANDKKRFAFSDDGLRIRASQGHSVEIDLQLDPMVPPDVLFHGTADRFLEVIRREGLRKMSRQHVHLSPDVKTASVVGVRHGRLVVLTVQAGEMHKAGRGFFRSANGVWLTDAVPPQFITFPSETP